VPHLATAGSRDPALATLSLEPRSRAAESFGALLGNIEFLTGDTLGSLLVTSSLPGEGKTTVAANLAIMFARQGRNVVLVDADVQHPSIHRHFGVYHSTGLSDYLRNPSLEAADLLRSSDVDALRLVTAGNVATTRVELVSSARVEELIHALGHTADLVILDGPSVIGVAETASLATYVDASLLVVNAEQTRRPTLEAAREALVSAGATVMGSVLNNVRVAGASSSLLARMRRSGHGERPAEEVATRS
jgi:capsular exopolysaccharide synthesis family protein